MGGLTDGEIVARWWWSVLRFASRLWWAVWIGPPMRGGGEFE